MKTSRFASNHLKRWIHRTIFNFSVFSAQTLICYKCIVANCSDPFNAAKASQIDCKGLCKKVKITGFTSEEAASNSSVKVAGK